MADSLPRRLRFEILRRDNFTCRYCGAQAPDVPLEVDHVIPRVLGGSDDPSNLVTACVDCNGGKSSTSPSDTIVADVAEDALRWAVARERAAEIQRADVIANERVQRWFHDIWSAYYGDDLHLLRHPWADSITQFVKRGLTMPDMERFIGVAIGYQARDPFKYFCGCAWRFLAERDEITRQIVEEI